MAVNVRGIGSLMKNTTAWLLQEYFDILLSYMFSHTENTFNPVNLKFLSCILNTLIMGQPGLKLQFISIEFCIQILLFSNMICI